MNDILWTMATSSLALSIVAVVSLAALVVGYFPLLKYFPVIGPYVAAAKLVSYIQIGLLCLLIGARIADERQEVKDLNSIVEAKTIDLNATVEAEKEASDARDQLAKQEAADQERIAGYETALKARPGNCTLTIDDRDRMRQRKPSRLPLAPAGN